MTSKGQLTGMTGVYLVLAELSRRGFVASPTSRSARGADILVTDPNCTHACSLQVKTNGKNASFWLLNPHAKEMVSPTHFYAVVNVLNDGHEFFVVPSRVVSRKMDVVKQGKSTWYSILRKNVAEFRDRWDLIGESDQGS